MHLSPRLISNVHSPQSCNLHEFVWLQEVEQIEKFLQIILQRRSRQKQTIIELVGRERAEELKQYHTLL